MSVIAWWALPIGATLVAVGWARWASRPRRIPDPTTSIEAHRRFLAALSRAEATSRPDGDD